MSKTFEQALTDKLIQHGMFDSQAKEVIEIAKKNEMFKDTMEDRWHDKIDGYPPMIMNIMWIGLKHIALEWIEQNKPQAFFRSMFVDN